MRSLDTSILSLIELVFIGCEAKIRDDDLTLTIRPHAVVFIMRFFSEQFESTSPVSNAVATERHLRFGGRELNLLTCKGLNPTFTSKIVPLGFQLRSEV